MRTLIALVIATAALSACGDGGSPTQPATVTTYDLSQVDGSDLPAVLQDSAGVTLSALSGSTIELRSNGRWRIDLSVRENRNGSIAGGPFADSGSYTDTQGNLRLVSAVYRDTIPGTLAGVTLSIIYDATFYNTPPNNLVELMFEKR